MKHASKLSRMMSDRRARQLVGFAGALALASIAQSALADSGTAIESGLSTFKSWFIGISTVVGIIAVMGCGYAKLTGRMNWGGVVAVMVGLGIIFSAPTIVGWMGGTGS